MPHAPITDLAYLSLRFLLSIIAGMAAAVVSRYGWKSYRSGGAWRLSTIIAFILWVATVLSIYDAIDNFALRPHGPITLASWLWFLFVDIPMPLLAIRLTHVREERDRLITELSTLGVTDPLTGLLNRRGFFELATTSISQARRTGTPVSLAMFDIDHFKAINDRYGHAAGDQVLQALGACFLADRRAGDLVGRVGGEEFAALLLASDEGMGIIGAERFRTTVKSTVLHPAGSGAQVTVSGGVAAVQIARDPEAALSLAFRAADEALYAAKRTGRDRVIAASTNAASS
jgi:diguanylate cyclase (GGDEF)-like protein